MLSAYLAYYVRGMEMFLRKVAGCILGLLMLAASATTMAGEDYEPIVDRFFAAMRDGEAIEATDFLVSGNRWLSKSGGEGIQALKTQLAGLPKLAGALRGHEKIMEERIGENYAYLVYLGLYERQPVRFKFHFYRLDGKWRFQHFAFDANFVEDIEKHADQKLLSGTR